MRISLFVVASLALLVPTPTARGIDYVESEPNNGFPPGFLPGNPLFNSGDRLLGSITANDIDGQYLRVAGSGSFGLSRYTFTLNTGGGDSLLDLYDASPTGFFLARNDDFPGLGGASRVVFDQFTTGVAETFGVDISGFSATDTFNYALTVERTTTPVTALGLLSGGLRTVSNATPFGAGTWYSFTLAEASRVVLDTFGSLVDDTEIALFGASGQTLAGNDDFGTGFLSQVTSVLQAGTYYVAVGGYESRYNLNTTTGAPIGWDRNGFSGGVENGGGVHTLNLRATAVPEPGSWALLAIGGACLVALRRAREPASA